MKRINAGNLATQKGHCLCDLWIDDICKVSDGRMAITLCMEEHCLIFECSPMEAQIVMDSCKRQRQKYGKPLYADEALKVISEVNKMDNSENKTTAKDRVIKEREELQEKIEKLEAFIWEDKRHMITTERYRKLSDVAADLLIEQYDIMLRYWNVLRKRLENWGEE